MSEKKKSRLGCIIAGAAGVLVCGIALLFSQKWFADALFLCGALAFFVCAVLFLARTFERRCVALAALAFAMDLFALAAWGIAELLYAYYFRPLDTASAFLFVFAALVPVAGIVLGVSALSKDLPRPALAAAIAAIVLPVLAVALFFILLGTGVAVISLM